MRKIQNVILMFIIMVLYTSCLKGLNDPITTNTTSKPAITEEEELISAILGGDAYTVESLLNKNEELIEMADQDENTPLHYAAWKGDIRIVKILIQHKANVNAQNKWGFTPLHELARREENNEIRDIVSQLILYGAKVNTVTNYGNTPLDIAEIKGQKEIVCILRQNGGKRSKHAINLPPVPEFARNLK